MATIIPDDQLAAGHNNAGGLNRLDEITDANGVKFVMPRGLPFRSRGQLRFRLNTTVARVGFDATAWFFTAMLIDQYALMLSTYEGLVTVRLALSSTTFANYNATLTMPDEVDLEYRPYVVGNRYAADFTGPCYINVSVPITGLEAL